MYELHSESCYSGASFNYLTRNKIMKKHKGIIIALTATALLMYGCAGNFDYIRPTHQDRTSNSVMINLPKDIVWNAAIPKLGSQFFIINNLDKSSGLINLSYSGDPEKYVDCGRIISYVSNLRGGRTYDFQASKAAQRFEVMRYGKLFNVDSRMGLEGRVNLIFEELEPNKTRVTANTKYVLTNSIDINGIHDTLETIAFNFNKGGQLSSSLISDLSERTTECGPTGELEYEILQTVK